MTEPVTEFSRYQFINRFRFSDDKTFLELRRRLRFIDRSDNRLYTALQKDTLLSIAFKFFRSFSRPAGLWWVIMDFNNIIDPTISFEGGEELIIPSEAFIREAFAIIPRKFLFNIQQVNSNG